MPSTDCQKGGIKFGRWKLFPVDSGNWELCHWHVATRGKNSGVEQWNRCGRYYQYNTFHLAIQYAADCELREKAYGMQMELQDALGEYERIVGEMVAALLPQAREVVA